MKKIDRLMCERPDRDVPKIKCGYPLPCPWHTVIIDTTQTPTTIPRQTYCKKCGGERLTLKYETFPAAGRPPVDTMYVTCDRCGFSWCEQPLAEGEDRTTTDGPPRDDDIV